MRMPDPIGQVQPLPDCLPCRTCSLPRYYHDPTMPIDRAQLLALWKLDELPACQEGMELAARFLERAGEAEDRLDEANIPLVRNGHDQGLTKSL